MDWDLGAFSFKSHEIRTRQDVMITTDLGQSVSYDLNTQFSDAFQENNRTCLAEIVFPVCRFGNRIKLGEFPLVRYCTVRVTDVCQGA